MPSSFRASRFRLMLAPDDADADAEAAGGKEACEGELLILFSCEEDVDEDVFFLIIARFQKLTLSARVSLNQNYIFINYTYLFDC